MLEHAVAKDDLLRTIREWNRLRSALKYAVAGTEILAGRLHEGGHRFDPDHVVVSLPQQLDCLWHWPTSNHNDFLQHVEVHKIIQSSQEDFYPSRFITVGLHHRRKTLQRQSVEPRVGLCQAPV